MLSFLQLKQAEFVDSMKCDVAKNAHHIVIFLNDERESNGAELNGDSSQTEDPGVDIFPDISLCHKLRTLTYVLWNPPDGASGDHEYDDFRSLIKAHHLLGKGHNICTYGVYVEESLLVEEKVRKHSNPLNRLFIYIIPCKGQFVVSNLTPSWVFVGVPVKRVQPAS